ncbi:sulfide:quinone oxidoreductase, mitochondrial-like [Argiope bruennichi]|uniref:sulfide:quinone oxidoreductase, mitochondrial-like n=1 Tax=Argiope bruennichi TaxID=94029 RepID=UPI0024955CA2|nr:sulfide:quinone oxidoreductase, mitochondrial-like [Argiope bruennichi]
MIVLMKMRKILPYKFLIPDFQYTYSILLQKRPFSLSHVIHKDSCKILIAGGGTGGITMAAKLLNLGEKDITVIEPSEIHYYQPLWTLVGGRKKSLQRSCLPTSNVMPKGVDWIKDKVMAFDPSSNAVHTEKNGKIQYDFLVVALGIKLAYEKVKGLPEAFDSKGVCSIYSSLYVEKTAKAMEDFQEGNAIFTQPLNPIKCAGAPQKIMYLAEEYFTKTGKRNKANLIFNTALPVIFSCKKYAKTLEQVAKQKNININYQYNLVEVKPESKEAVFEKLGKEESSGTEIFKYEMLHITPPMVPPPSIRESSLSDASGFMGVNKNTLQSTKFENVFGLGDCVNVPTSKTMAAVAGQSGVVAQNLELAIKGKFLTHGYYGYTSCPLVTGYNKGILAEFNYEMLPEETLPIDQSRERALFYYIKKDLLPFLYWNFMLKGNWSGPKFVRKVLHLGLAK